MTELQYGMIALSVLVIAGVFGYNKWQESRHRKLAEAALKPQMDDVLLDRPTAEFSPKTDPADIVREEPVWVAEPELRVDLTDTPDESARFAAHANEVPHASSPRAQSSTAAPAASEIPADDLPSLALPAELLDPRVEFIVSMELVEPVSSQQILHSQRETLRRLNKPVHWIAFNEQKREWQRLRSDTDLPVRSLRVGLQLVNRLGPVSDADVATFAGAMQALADELMAVADMPPTRVLDQAAEVDRFCAAVDLEIGLNLVSRGLPFPGTKIRALAEAAGMVLGLEGYYTRYDDQGRAQYTLQNYENT
ncbi:MAG: cell division protein ZipA C-terminal FtsZ-binding domain-containing protein, partial [Azonexus sp.]|nr:cell division protein ZipA C-terminal FtsZ-binding domain-containing protein [Azonexus sp.]